MFAAQLATHAFFLHLPYYWDEAGYYIPAAFDFLRTGTLIPFSTLSNAHPPGLSLLLAAAWKLFGFAPLVTRSTMCLISAYALVGVYRLARALLGTWAPAAAVALMTGCYPVWFSQGMLAQADTLAAAFTVWGLRFAVPGRCRQLLWPVLLFSLAALTKEIAVATPLALAALEAIQVIAAWRQGDAAGHRQHGRRAAALCAPAAPLALWFGYHRWRTGFLFGNPEFLRYNAQTTLRPERVLLALGHRVFHLAAHLNLFVPVVIALGSLLLPPLASRAGIPREVRHRIWAVLVANVVLFSVLGGALLTRYLLPMYPLVLLLAVGAVWRRFRHWEWYAALAVFAFVAALLLPPLYRVAPEDTLAWCDAVRLEQQAIDVVVGRYPGETVLTAWPVSDGLRKPELGYLQRPVPVVAIDNFSLPMVEAELHSPVAYSTAIVFSTKDDPRELPFALGRWERGEETRWFGFHQDLPPEQVAALLGGTVVWQAQRGAQWAAVLRFHHPALASL